MIVYISIPENGRLPYVEGYMARQSKRNDLPDGIWEFVKNTQVMNELSKLPGQHSATGLGRCIVEVMSSSDGPRKWVEVGSWNGMGTTLCIQHGIHARQNKEGIEVYSYEIDPNMFTVATENMKHALYLNTHIFLRNGRLPYSADFPDETQIDLGKNERGAGTHFFLYFESEKYLYERAEQIPLPFAPEAAVLDGGEYTGQYDWESLDKSKLQWVFLDDINTFKNKKLFTFLRNSESWTLYKEDTAEGNGWAVFHKV